MSVPLDALRSNDAEAEYWRVTLERGRDRLARPSVLERLRDATGRLIRRPAQPGEVPSDGEDEPPIGAWWA